MISTTTPKIHKIISGAQVGVDQGALDAARGIGFPTGGTMPKGFLTLVGEKPAYADLYGMVEHSSQSYPPRTRANVTEATATVIVGALAIDSRGNMSTLGACRDTGRPCLILAVQNIEPETKSWERAIDQLCVDLHEICELTQGDFVLNVAGHSGRNNLRHRREAYRKGYHTVLGILRKLNGVPL